MFVTEWTLLSTIRNGPTHSVETQQWVKSTPAWNGKTVTMDKDSNEIVNTRVL